MTSGRILAAIADKRAGRRLPEETIRAVVDDFTAGRVPDYQMSAWLATVACQGLDLAETVALTRSYVDSGDRLGLADLDPPVVDKHSTGGVGDKVTLVVAPVVAACGVPVMKMSGRSLGWAGGTIDKLESIDGLRLDLEPDEIRDTLARAGMVITGHSPKLVPADGATYALRDVTATVESIPLIAASVMSKKVASQAHGVVLDVKYGEGALVPDPAEAQRLAELMLAVGRELGMRCRCVLSDMSQPLGRAVGNALEVKEALSALGGEHVPGLTPLCETIAALMVQIGHSTMDEQTAVAQVRDAITSGAARQRFRQWVDAQGGDVEQIDHPDRLPSAARQVPVPASGTGYVTAVRARLVGEAALLLGAGRMRLGDTVDRGAGVVVLRRVGDPVREGEPVAVMHVTGGDTATAGEMLSAAVHIGPQPPATVSGWRVLGQEA
ncbi:MAG TPA: thymidine phosphorylase [Candidatus Limnocylindrales bacterium]|nr:thymidine phosphorylase [Candidatus Limnocylindrales bacterium]